MTLEAVFDIVTNIVATVPVLKIVHIGTVVSGGGAARAMLNLHQGLHRAGHHSSILTVSADTLDATIYELNSPIVSAKRKLIDFIENYICNTLRTPISNTHFSLDYGLDLDINAIPVVKEANIIHLHWVSGFLSTKTLLALKALNKPIFWTLHDLRPITGGCHFSAGCEHFKESCVRCPQLQSNSLNITETAQQALKEVTDQVKFNYIAPSTWLADCVRSSRVGFGSPINVVPYGIWVEQFPETEQKAARAVLKLRDDAQYILLGATDFLEKRKGLRQAAEILQIVAKLPEMADKIRQGRLRILCFGNNIPTFLDWPMDHLGYLTDAKSLSTAYCASDLLLFTSEEDNLPNIVLEAMSCGLSVAALNVGGLPDLVSEHTGLLLNPDDAAMNADLICKALLNPQQLKLWGTQAKDTIRRSFTLDRQANTLLNLYYDAITHHPVMDDVVSKADLQSDKIQLPEEMLSQLKLAIEHSLKQTLFELPQKVDQLETEIRRFERYIEKCRRAPWKLYRKRI